MERDAQRAAHCVQHGLVDFRGPECTRERRQPVPLRFVLAFLDMRCEVVERAPRSSWRQIRGARDVERATQLIDVVFVRQRRVLVEPLRNHELSRRAFCFAAVIEPDAGAHERLHASRHRRGAEAERHPVLQRALEAVDRRDAESRCDGLHS